MYNKAILTGRVGKDVEMRYSQKGDAIATVSFATSDKWKNKTTGDYDEKVQWHRLKAFGQTAELIGKILKKGSLATVDGSIEYEKYTDKEGIERQATFIRVTSFKAIPTGSKSEGSAGNTAQSSADIDDDEIPF